MLKQFITNITRKELEKVINLQDEIGNPFIVLHKPRAKESIIEFDSDTAAFDIINNELVFDFLEMEGFSLDINKIKKIVYEELEKGMLIIHLHLKYGNDYVLHFKSV